MQTTSARCGKTFGPRSPSMDLRASRMLILSGVSVTLGFLLAVGTSTVTSNSSFRHPYAAVCYAILCCAVLAVAVRPRHILSPLGWAAYGFILYYLFPLAEHLFVGRWRFYASVTNESAYLQLEGLVFLGWLGLQLGWHAAAKADLFREKLPPARVVPCRALLLGVTMLAVGMLGWLQQVKESGGLYQWLALQWHVRGGNASPLLWLVEPGAYVALVSLYSAKLSARQRFVLSLVIVGFAGALLSVSLGSRIQAVRIFLIWVVLNELTKTRRAYFVLKWVVAVGVVIAGMIIWGTLRGTLGSPLLVPRVTNPYTFVVDKLDSFYTFDSFVLVATECGKSQDYLWGATYLKPLFALIPRSIWPEKPLGITLWTMKVFRPELYGAGVSAGPTILGEIYANFGVLGVVPCMFLFGIFTKMVSHYGRSAIASRSPARIVTYAALLFSVFEQFRGDFHGITLNLILRLLAMHGVLLLARSKRHFELPNAAGS